MRFLRRSLVSACALAVLLFGAPGASAASPARPIHLTKDCSTYTGESPSHCAIAASDFATIPVGATVWYEGPVLTNIYFLSSTILLDAGGGSTASGYCIFDARATESTGLCTFWSGTGQLSGFTSILTVTVDAAGEWHWDGVYYFADDPAAPRWDPSARGAQPS